MIKRSAKNLFYISFLILAILYLLRLIPFIFRDGRMWGFNHLIFLPPVYAIIYFVLGGAALITPFLSISRKWGESFAGWLSRVLYDSPRKYFHRLIFIAVLSVLFIIFRAPTHFGGDGYQYLANIGSPSGTFIKWSEIAITRLLLTVQSLIGPRSQQTALAAFQIVSVFSGMITVWFFFLISEITVENKTGRIIIFFTSLFSGAALLFFGYVENYPMLWIGLTGFTYFGLKYIKTDSGFMIAGLFLAFGITIHFLMAVFIPAYIYLIFCKGKMRAIYARLRPLFLGGGAILFIIVAVLFLKKYKSDLYFENIFLPPFHGKPIAPYYALFSPSHLVDILNQLLLLSPLLPFFVVLSAGNLSKVFKDKSGSFLALASIGSLLFLFIIDPTLAMPRDWDLFSLSAFTLTLLTTALAVNATNDIKSRLLIPLLTLTFLAASFFLIANLKEKSSVEYDKHIIDLDISKARGTMTILRDYYLDSGDRTRADSVNDILHRSYPDFFKINQALETLAAGDTATARAIMNTIIPDRFSKDYHYMQGFYNLAVGNYAEGLKEARKGVQLQKYYEYSYILLAIVYNKLRQYDNEYEALKTGYSLNNRNQEIITRLALYHVEQRQYDSCIYYSNRAISLDSTNSPVYYILARTYVIMRSTEMARKYASLYLKYQEQDPLFAFRWQELSGLIPGLPERPN
jgi:tetratricopeptide (TPR) repeat protein